MPKFQILVTHVVSSTLIVDVEASNSSAAAAAVRNAANRGDFRTGPWTPHPPEFFAQAVSPRPRGKSRDVATAREPSEEND